MEDEIADPPSTLQHISHKNKLNVILKNDSAKEIEVWTPLWDEHSAVQCQWPLGTKLQLSGSKGWSDGEWEGEAFCIKVKPQANFRCWVGLMPPMGDSIKMRVPHRNNGVLIFPIKVDSELWEARVKV